MGSKPQKRKYSGLHSTSNWHPKITPYRLIASTLPIGLCTAKAISTWNGAPFLLPPSLELATSTLLPLLLFSVNAYDYNDRIRRPRYLTWLFEPDCMDLVWRVLAACFSVSRPHYYSQERPSISRMDEDGSTHPPVTAYRILFCAVVGLFGMLKAALGYAGFSAAMTWVDWAMAVPAATSLYCLGLYEYNDGGIWPGFFEEDYSGEVFTVFIFIVKTPICVAWIVLFLYGMVDTEWIADPSKDIKLIAGLYALRYNFLRMELYVAGVTLGAVAVLYVGAKIVSNTTWSPQLNLNRHLPSFLPPLGKFILKLAHLTITLTTHILINIFLLATLSTILLLWIPTARLVLKFDGVLHTWLGLGYSNQLVHIPIFALLYLVFGGALMILRGVLRVVDRIFGKPVDYLRYIV